jgi:hypothetical protein
MVGVRLGEGFGLGKNQREEEELRELGFAAIFIRSLNVPCHTDGRGDGASARGSGARRLAGLPYTKRMRMSLSSDI